MNLLPLVSNVRLPLAHPLMPTNPCNARCIVAVFILVMHILKVPALPEISPPIIEFIPVNVVNFQIRPAVRHHHEDDPVHFMAALKKLGFSITLYGYPAHCRSRQRATLGNFPG